MPHPRLRHARPPHRRSTAPAIDATLDTGLSNALIESVNTKIRLLTRIAFGFRSPTHSSPSPCSASDDTDPSYPVGAHGSSRRAG